MASPSPDDVRPDFCFINRLPQETLSEIFTIAYLSIPHSSKTRNPLSLKALPRVLFRVDRRWRATARSTKLIWLDFEITSKNKPTWVSKTAISRSVKRARAVLNQWLKLACTHERDPRGLQFLFETGLKVSPVDTEILAVLAEYSNHWQRARFDIPIRATVVLSPIQGRLSRLESIELDLQRDMMDEMGEIEHGTRAFPPSFAAALKHAPKLTRLSCYGFWEDNATIQIDLPFQQLRNVCVVDKYALDCYHLLRKSALSLEFATITPISIDPTAIWPAQLASGLPVIRLPSLQRLMYLNDHTETVGIKGGTIFRSLEVPNLRTLILFDQDGRASYHEAFEMLLRSRCRSLKRLDLRGAYANAASDIANLLDITNNSLESLYVDGVLNSLFSQYRRQKGTGTTAAIIANLASRIQGGLGKLKIVIFRLRVTNAEYLGILKFKDLFKAVLDRNATGGKALTLILRVSGSPLCVKQLHRELETTSGGRGDGKVIIEAV